MPPWRFDLCRKRLGQCPANAADLSGLAPSYIVAAEHNPLRDDGIRDAELLGAAGVSTQLRNASHMVHGFVDMHSRCRLPRKQRTVGWQR